MVVFFFFKQKTAYEIVSGDWSSDVCSSDLPLESLADRRRVIFYDQLGCGRSDRPDDLSLWNVDRFVTELAQVRSALNLDRLHLFGSSWGGMLAMQYVLDRQGDQPELESL